MLIETLSTKLRKAFIQGNSVQVQFTNPLAILTTIPANQPGPVPPVIDGVWPQGPDAMNGIAPNRILIIPYADGPPGSTFFFKIFGWRMIEDCETDTTGTIGRPLAPLWLPMELAEFYCISTNFPGPQPQNSPDPAVGYIGNYVISPTENFCDTISLVAGSLGLGGEIIAPGNGQIGGAMVDLRGCQKFQFDFANTEGMGNFSMNALWCKA